MTDRKMDWTLDREWTKWSINCSLEFCGIRDFVKLPWSSFPFFGPKCAFIFAQTVGLQLDHSA